MDNESVTPFNEKLTATESIDPSVFNMIDKRFGKLLMAAEGLKQLGELIDIAHNEADTPAPNMGYLVESMGQHFQDIRNDVAQDLEPIFKSFGVETIGY